MQLTLGNPKAVTFTFALVGEQTKSGGDWRTAGENVLTLACATPQPVLAIQMDQLIGIVVLCGKP
jgi:hypothetical protein